jgi:hypothetical protein
MGCFTLPDVCDPGSPEGTGGYFYGPGGGKIEPYGVTHVKIPAGVAKSHVRRMASGNQQKAKQKNQINNHKIYDS